MFIVHSFRSTNSIKKEIIYKDSRNHEYDAFKFYLYGVVEEGGGGVELITELFEQATSKEI